jgi:pyrroline-5-carboxylate reductase
MKNAKLAFMGGGNLTRAIVSGLVQSGYPADLIYVGDRNADKVEYFKSDLGVNASLNMEEILISGDILIISIKPQGFIDGASEYANIIRDKKPMIISVMAGVNINTIYNCFGLDLPIVRAMPNTASSVHAGATGLFANEGVSSQQKDIVEHIFRNLGVIAWVDKEEHINAVIAIASSSPAYFLYFIEIMQEVGLDMGLDKNTVQLLSLQSAYGAAKMGLQCGEGVSVLREKITSKGGCTAAAIDCFKAENLSGIVKDAMVAAVKRGEELENANYSRIAEDKK